VDTLSRSVLCDPLGGYESLPSLFWTTGGERHAKNRDFKQGI